MGTEANPTHERTKQVAATLRQRRMIDGCPTRTITKSNGRGEPGIHLGDLLDDLPDATMGDEVVVETTPSDNSITLYF